MNSLQVLLLAAIAFLVVGGVLGVGAVKSAFAGPWNPDLLAALALICYAGFVGSLVALAFVGLGHA